MAAQPGKKFISRKDAASYCGYRSIFPLITMERSGKLTPVRFNGPKAQVFYDLEELDALAKQQREASK